MGAIDHMKTLNNGSKRLQITFPCHLLQHPIDLLRQSALIGKFSSSTLSLSDIKDWAFTYWSGLKDIFFIDLESKFFVAMFETKEDRNYVHKQKGWFCQGSGLYTMLWVPNFNPQASII